MNGKWLFNEIDNEIWNGEKYDTREEAIAAGKAEMSGTFAIGQAELILPCGVDVDFILENVALNTIDDLNSDICGDYLDDVTAEHRDELEEKFNEILFDWMKKYNYNPNFYRIINEEII